MRPLVLKVACCGVLLFLIGKVSANDVEPRLYSNVPEGTNFLSVGYAHSKGEVTFDSSIPVADARGEVDAMVLSYSRGLDLGGKSALLTVAVPYAEVALEGLLLGEPASGQRHGIGDPRVRLAVNLYGAPSLNPEQFGAYQQRTIVGASISTSVPVGRYVEERVLNAGSNRWNVIGQLGVSHRVRNWMLEGALGLSWYSDNDKVRGKKLEQDPIKLLRGAVSYYITPRVWIGAGFVYTRGGATRLDGMKRRDHQDNWRTGIALSVPLGRRHRLQLRATEGVSARIGANFRMYRVIYTYTF
jgi:hypothetical protein